MWLFTKLFGWWEQSEIPLEWVYLGEGMTLLRNPEILKQEKRDRINELLTDFRFTRPKLSDCNINDLNSIFAYIARENLECATNDECGDSSRVNIRQVEMLCRIVLWRLQKKEYVHVTIHPNYMKANHEDRNLPYDLLAYFQVWILPVPPEPIQWSHLDEFKRQYNSSLIFYPESWS